MNKPNDMNVSNGLSPITGKSYAAIKCESVTAFTSQTLEEQRRFFEDELGFEYEDDLEVNMTDLLKRIEQYLDIVYYETGWSVANHLSNRFSVLVAQSYDNLELDVLLSSIDDFTDLYYDSIVRVSCLIEDGECIMLAIKEALLASSQQKDMS